MRHARSLRVLGHTIRLTLFLLLGYWAVDSLVETLGSRNWSPAVFFWLLITTGAVSLVWRTTLDLRSAIRRLRS